MTDNNRQNPAVEISERQRRVLPILLSSRTVAEGCRRARVNRDTFYQWMREPDFRKEYERQSKVLVQSAISELQLLACESVAVLGRLLKVKSSHVRYRTATTILETLFKHKEHEELSDRIQAVEEYLETHEKNY